MVGRVALGVGLLDGWISWISWMVGLLDQLDGWIHSVAAFGGVGLFALGGLVVKVSLLNPQMVSFLSLRNE